jgi:hypothetical protein
MIVELELPAWGYGDYFSMTIDFLVYSLSALSGFLNTVVIAWALENKVGFISVDYFREWKDTLNQWTEAAMFLDIVSYPVNFVMDIFEKADTAETFNPTNEGFLIFFEFIIYPILYMCMFWPAIINIAILPLLMVVYGFNKDLFIDYEASNAYEEENFVMI